MNKQTFIADCEVLKNWYAFHVDQMRRQFRAWRNANMFTLYSVDGDNVREEAVALADNLARAEFNLMYYTCTLEDLTA